MTPLISLTHRSVTVITADTYANGSECYTASDPNLPGCFASGASPDEASAKLAEARHAMLASLNEDDEALRPLEFGETWKAVVAPISSKPEGVPQSATA